MLEAYRQHETERAAQGIPAKPLSASQVAGLVELLKNPPAGEEQTLLDLLANRILQKLNLLSIAKILKIFSI